MEFGERMICEVGIDGLSWSACNWIIKIWLYPRFLTVRAKCDFKITSELVTKRLCTNLLTINGNWDRIFCELGIDRLSWSACNGSSKSSLYPQFVTVRAKCDFKITSELATRRLCTNLLTINGIWDRIFCELGIDGLSWSACNGSTKIWRAHFDRPWEFYALNFLDENDDIFRLFPFVAYMIRGDVFKGGQRRIGWAFLLRKLK